MLRALKAQYKSVSALKFQVLPLHRPVITSLSTFHSVPNFGNKSTRMSSWTEPHVLPLLPPCPGTDVFALPTNPRILQPSGSPHSGWTHISLAWETTAETEPNVDAPSPAQDSWAAGHKWSPQEKEKSVIWSVEITDSGWYWTVCFQSGMKPHSSLAVIWVSKSLNATSCSLAWTYQSSSGAGDRCLFQRAHRDPEF